MPKLDELSKKSAATDAKWSKITKARMAELQKVRGWNKQEAASVYTKLIAAATKPTIEDRTRLMADVSDVLLLAGKKDPKVCAKFDKLVKDMNLLRLKNIVAWTAVDQAIDQGIKKHKNKFGPIA